MPLAPVVLTGFALAVAALIATGVAALRGTAPPQRMIARQWVAHTIELRQQLNEASALASDAESGGLGFAFMRDNSHS